MVCFSDKLAGTCKPRSGMLPKGYINTSISQKTAISFLSLSNHQYSITRLNFIATSINHCQQSVHLIRSKKMLLINILPLSILAMAVTAAPEGLLEARTGTSASAPKCSNKQTAKCCNGFVPSLLGGVLANVGIGCVDSKSKSQIVMESSNLNTVVLGGSCNQQAACCSQQTVS